MARFVPNVPVDPTAGAISLAVPATGAAAIVTLTDPGSAAIATIQLLEIIAGYTAGGTGTMTVAQGAVTVYLNVQNGPPTVMPQSAWLWPTGQGNIVITLPGNGSLQNYLIVTSSNQ